MVYLVYGITDCPACLRACALLMELNLEYVFVETDFAKSYRKQLQKQYRHPTFPIVVRESEFETLIVGGYDELCRHVEQAGLTSI